MGNPAYAAWWERERVRRRNAVRERAEASMAAERDKRERAAITPKQNRPAASAYTTKAAVAWGERQGWLVLDRESHGPSNASDGSVVYRRHDLRMGADVMFTTPEGIVLVQAGGRSEFKRHWERFESLGGKWKCDRLKMRFAYVEFDRGNPEPIRLEWWA